MSGHVEDIIEKTHGVSPAPADSDTESAPASSETADESPADAPLPVSFPGFPTEEYRRRMPPYREGYRRWAEKTDVDADTIATLATLGRAAVTFAGGP